MFVSQETFLNALLLLLGDNSDRSRALVKEVLDACDKQSVKRDIVTADDPLIDIYKVLIRTVIEDKVSQDDHSASKLLLLRLKGMEAINAFPVARDVLTDILSGQDPISPEQIDRYLKSLTNALALAEIDATTRKIFAKSQKIFGIQDADGQEVEIADMRKMLDTAMKNIDGRLSATDTKASETYVSLSDRTSIERALNTFIERNVRGIIRTGLQGLNRALGTRGGFGLGETVVFAAGSHNYKSGMLVSIMLWTVIYNRILVEPGKKALVYFISLENEVNQNLMDVFRALYCRIERKQVDMTHLSVTFITDWLITYFAQFDIELFIDRYTPHEFSYNKFVKRFNHFADLNYQMILFDLDYMSEARGIDPGDTMSTSGQIQLIKENYLKFANHAKQLGYLLATGHQLTKRADEIAHSSGRYPVKKFNNSLMADSSDVHRIIDMLFFMHLENNVDGRKFLTVVNRKNRGSKDTPEKDKFFAYPFTEFGVEDDIDGFPQYVTDIDAWGIEQGARDDTIAEAALF